MEFFEVPIQVLEDNRLNVYAKMIYIAMCALSDNNGKCCEPAKTICEYASVSRKTYYKYKKVLKELGYIESWRSKNEAREFEPSVTWLIGYKD